MVHLLSHGARSHDNHAPVVESSFAKELDQRDECSFPEANKYSESEVLKTVKCNGIDVFPEDKDKREDEQVVENKSTKERAKYLFEPHHVLNVINLQRSSSHRPEKVNVEELDQVMAGEGDNNAVVMNTVADKKGSIKQKDVNYNMRGAVKFGVAGGHSFLYKSLRN
jgi:hypothetical protein